MSEELKPCPFCGGEARLDQRVTQSLWNSGDAVFSHVACDECDISGQDFCDDPDGEEAIEWWNRRAQPAEAEGAVIAAKCVNRKCLRHNAMLSDYGLTLPHGEALVRQSDHLAALSAVTAERDRLRELINSANGFQDALERERDQLRAELETVKKVAYGNLELLDENAKLRAEVDPLLALLGKSLPVVEAHAGASHMLDGFRPIRNKWDELVDGIRAVMAAKEAGPEHVCSGCGAKGWTGNCLECIPY